MESRGQIIEDKVGLIFNELIAIFRNFRYKSGLSIMVKI